MTSPPARRRKRALTRRALLAALPAGGLVALAGCSSPTAPTSPSPGATDGTQSTADSPASPASPDGRHGPPGRLATEVVADGFSSPVGAEFPGGVAGRGYVVEQSGRILVVRDGERATFLDVRDRMADIGGGYSEMGLLGLAFHPDFPDDDRAFVRYSAPPRGDTPSSYSHTFVLSEFRATPDRAAPDSERVLLSIPEPQSNHNAGSVAFGPDGLLYVGVGDGGGGGDQGTGHVSDWYDAVDGGNGQDVTANLLGSVLRIDVDGRAAGEPYAIPGDNPLVGREGLDEHYAWGFRNPWRFSFDAETGDFLVADVGESAWEEVSRVVRGGNYGWNVREGAHCFEADTCPRRTPDGDPLRDPVIEYPHSGDAVSGIAVIGGYVYRGDALADALAGRYVFADWRADGRLFVATPRESGMWPVEAVDLAGDAAGASGVLSFGQDPDRELYVCTTDDGDGAVHRLVGDA